MKQIESTFLKVPNLTPKLVGGRNIAVVRKRYNNEKSFSPAKRVFQNIEDANLAIAGFAVAEKATAVYATTESVTHSWERIRV